MTQNLPTLRDTDPKVILARYLSDETTEQIAKSYGVTRQALGKYLLLAAEDEWKQAQVARAIARKERAEDTLDAIGLKIENANAEERARIQVSLAHARESLKAAQWDLERVCRRIYGQEVTPDQLGKISITLNIGGDGATTHRTIDHNSENDSQ